MTPQEHRGRNHRDAAPVYRVDCAGRVQIHLGRRSVWRFLGNAAMVHAEQ